jgi:hypothetical protein
MAMAMIYPEAPDKGGRGKKGSKSLGGFSDELLRQARAVLAFSEPLALRVRDGKLTINANGTARWPSVNTRACNRLLAH